MFNALRSRIPSLPVVGTHSFSAMMGHITLNAQSHASGVYLSANRAYFCPFHLDEPTIISKLWVLNGATASGNIDMGVYTAGMIGPESLLFSVGSTAQSGTDTYQLFDVTDRLLPPGDYYLAIAMDNVTGTVYRATTNLGVMSMEGWYQQSTAFPLPSPTVGTVAAVNSGATMAFGYLANGRVTI